jgi:hypothetical protein
VRILTPFPFAGRRGGGGGRGARSGAKTRASASARSKPKRIFKPKLKKQNKTKKKATKQTILKRIRIKIFQPSIGQQKIFSQ